MFGEKWDIRFLELAKHISQWSKDPNTQVGAIIVDNKKRIVSAGFNGFPIGINDTPDRLNNRDLKLQLVRHAEENAITFSQRDLEGCSIYVWPLPPCNRCATSIIQSGIKYVGYNKNWVYASNKSLSERWYNELLLSFELFGEANVYTLEINL